MLHLSVGQLWIIGLLIGCCLCLDIRLHPLERSALAQP